MTLSDNEIQQSLVEKAHSRSVSPETTRQRLENRLEHLYGFDVAMATLPRILDILEQRRQLPAATPIDESDVLLISYADHLRSDHKSPLATLGEFLGDELKQMVSGVHVLPFYPDSGDGGFAVRDYLEVKARNGTWDDITKLTTQHRVMFDCVLNHTSTSHPWFKGFLAGDERYADYFIVPDEDFDTTNVVRPRRSPLLTQFGSVDGVKKVWTTFGHEQADLNYRNPDVLIEMIDIITRYIELGAQVLRFDAPHFAWKESGSSCVHLPQAHEIIKIMRDVLDAVDPSVVIISETNVSHAENITYFGDGSDEAQLVYNFPLPGLLVHTLHTGDNSYLIEWAKHLKLPSDEVCFFNYTACHDGIATRGASAILDTTSWMTMIDKTVEHGGKILHRSTPEGEMPYEMCISYFDALSPLDEDLDLAVDRFLVSQAIALAFRGVPGIYFSSLFGAPTWSKGSGFGSWIPDDEERYEADKLRNANREKYRRDQVDNAIGDTGSRAGKTFESYRTLLTARRGEKCFHPIAAQNILDIENVGIFGLERISLANDRILHALHNVTTKRQVVTLASGQWTDIITGNSHSDTVELPRYGVAWLAQPTSRHSAE